MILGIASADRLSAKRSPDGSSYWGGSGFVRIGQYLDHITVDKVVIGDLIWKYDQFVINAEDEAEHIPDVLIIQRLMHEGLARHVQMARANGQIIINDIDDWYWGLSPANMAWQHSHPKVNPKENINHYKSIISSSSMVTVSTPYLADRLSEFVRCPIVIMENTIDLQRFTIHEQTTDDKPILGWAGSTAHRSGDLETVSNILRKLHRNGTYRFMHLGHNKDVDSFAKVMGLPEDAVQTIDLCPPETYPSGFVMDVGIVPLTLMPFNQAKSDIKGLEYAAAGIPFVAQNTDSYIRLNKLLGVGRVAKKPIDWHNHLRALEDPLLRKEEGLANRERIEPRDISHGIARWNDFLDSL